MPRSSIRQQVVQVNSNKLVEDDIKEEYNQIIVPKGKRSQIVLADNSKIWINSGSKVIYPRAFEGKYREIYVEGEVYLNVTHDTSKPFIVNTSGFEVRVLGTSFNISAYKNRGKSRSRIGRRFGQCKRPTKSSYKDGT